MTRRERERLYDSRSIGFEIPAKDGAADPLEIGSGLAADVTAIEIIETGMGQLLERVGQRGQCPQRSGRRRAALHEECGGKTRSGGEGIPFLVGVSRLRGADRVTLPCVPDRIRQEEIPRQLPAEGSGHFERKGPARYRPCNREGRIGSAGRDRIMASLAIAGNRRQGPGRATGLDRVHPIAWLTDEPESIATDRVHVRVDDRYRRGHCDHGLEGVSALGKNDLPGGSSQIVWCRHRGGGEDGRVVCHETRISDDVVVGRTACTDLPG
jgi:hypothetical protein